MDARAVDHFRELVDTAAARMERLPDAAASRQPAPGKWCHKEILGHLIDSAAHNQTRFVRAQVLDELVFPGYDQDAWVRVQRYRERSWTDLIATWRAYNHQIAAIMEAVRADERDRPRSRHNLDQIAFGSLPPDMPATLGFLMRDYAAHLHHHLVQILGPEAPAGRPA